MANPQKTASLFAGLIFLLVSHSLVAQRDACPVPAPSGKDFTGIISFLASDELEGRETGTQGADLAARYIASRMAGYGLEPFFRTDPALRDGANPAGIFYHSFTVRKSRIEHAELTLTTGGTEPGRLLTFTPGVDFVPEPVPFNCGGEYPLVFAGYGVQAPGKLYNDFQGIAVKNRAVLIMEGVPGHADAASEATALLGRDFEELYGSASKKLRRLQESGAAAVLIVDPSSFSAPAGSGIRSEEEDDFRFYLPDDTLRITIPTFYVSAEAVRQLLQGSGIRPEEFEKRAAQLIPGSRNLEGKKIRFTMQIVAEPVTVRNVVGLIRGKDTTRNILIGAHYDHLGIRNGQIFNGADDNASGVAGMLSLAEKWRQYPEKPACNLIFAAWTGEECGKLGSICFARMAPVIPDRLSLVVNADMISRSAPEDTAATALSVGTMTAGSDLRKLAENANRRLEKPFILDLWDVTGRSGSDYAPFVAKGVPIVTFHSGWNADYHTPLDDPERIDPSKMERILRIINDIIWNAAQTPPIR